MCIQSHQDRFEINRNTALVGQEMEKMDVQGLRQSFDQYLLELEKERQWFSQHQEAFKELRDKRFAHLDVKLVGPEYKIAEVKGPDWKTVKERLRISLTLQKFS